MQKHYYAAEYRYGSTVWSQGTDTVYQFDCKEDRTYWIGKGKAQDGPGYRAAVTKAEAQRLDRTGYCRVGGRCGNTVYNWQGRYLYTLDFDPATCS